MTLETKHISKSFGDVRAVRDVSLTVEPGRIMALVGVSGSGKSTLLALLAGLLDADAGQVLLGGVPVAGPGAVLVAGHADIRLVPQSFSLMPNVSVRDNIGYALRFFDADYRTFRVDELLTICGLTNLQHRLPKEISGGEKQRVAIARAVATRPAVLLLDEPFSHLDAPNRYLMQTMLAALVRPDNPTDRPTACLFVTHEAPDALALADTLGVLEAGQLVQSGPPTAVYDHPKTATVAALTGAANFLTVNQLAIFGQTKKQPKDALFCIRPEAVRLTKRVAPGQIVGTVTRAVFRGSFSDVTVDVAGVGPLQAVSLRHTWQVGQRVGVKIVF